MNLSKCSQETSFHGIQNKVNIIFLFFFNILNFFSESFAGSPAACCVGVSLREEHFQNCDSRSLSFGMK